MIKLLWQPLVESIRNGHFEPLDSSGGIKFMYCSKRNTFVSDPFLLEQILRARAGRGPFFLIGQLGTGKNVFLDLVARGGPTDDTAMKCVDENVNASTDEQLEKLFGRGGIVETNPKALIHFDFMQNAIDWPPFLDRFLELALNHKLTRTDGTVVENMQVRVVGGATCELEPLLASKPDSLFHYIYHHLCPDKPFRTRPLSEQTSRIENLLCEIMATQVLDPRSDVNEEQIRQIDEISENELRILKEHSWPGGFGELIDLVREAISKGAWRDVIARRVSCKVFLIWSSQAREKAERLNGMLNKSGISTFFSPKSMRAGEWWPQIKMALSRSHFVIFCITKNVFNIDKEGVDLEELRETIDRSRRMVRPFLFPVSLDGSHPEDFQAVTAEQYNLIDTLKKYQWFFVDTETGDGFDKLLSELKARCQERLQAAMPITQFST